MIREGRVLLTIYLPVELCIFDMMLWSKYQVKVTELDKRFVCLTSRLAASPVNDIYHGQIWYISADHVLLNINGISNFQEIYSHMEYETNMKFYFQWHHYSTHITFYLHWDHCFICPITLHLAEFQSAAIRKNRTKISHFSKMLVDQVGGKFQSRTSVNMQPMVLNFRRTKIGNIYSALRKCIYAAWEICKKVCDDELSAVVHCLNGASVWMCANHKILSLTTVSLLQGNRSTFRTAVFVTYSK